MAKNTKTELEHWLHGMFILGLLLMASIIAWMSVVWIVASAIKPVL